MRALTHSAFLVAALAACSFAGCADQPASHKQPKATEPSPLGDKLPINDRLSIAHLDGPVDVVRDKYGRPHIYATSLTDAMRVEGYLVASDRWLELELFRRVSEGRMAEILSLSEPGIVDTDIAFRHIGLGRVGKAEYAALAKGSELREALDAYSDGVSQLFAKIRSKEVPLPHGATGIPIDAFTEWTGADSLAIGRLQTYLLSYDADLDVRHQALFDAARSTFTAADPDAAVAKRAGLERDLLRFAPADPATTTTGYPSSSATSAHWAAGPTKPPSTVRPGVAHLARGYLAAMARVREMLAPAGFGSNNFSIAPSRSATGHTLIASDPHLSLSAPSVFWPVSIDVTSKEASASDLHVGGVAFPGIPAIILGHNQHVAWGATVAYYDVADAYAETLSADGSSVTFQGKEVALETIDETIKLQDGKSFVYQVKVVPHHGPILPVIDQHRPLPLDPKAGAISIRWTGNEPTTELEAVMGLLRAKDVDEARQALVKFQVGAQNWMLGDTSGNILWTSHARVPVRDKGAFTWDAATYTGTLPAFVLPGDGSAEWKGFLPDDMVPWKKNPSEGFISTANNDPIGGTLDNDPSNDTLPDGTPMYLSANYDLGFREGRIHKRINDHAAPLTTKDLADIQADSRSAMGAALTPVLLDAIDRAQEEKKTPGTHPDLAGVVGDAAFDAKQIATIRTLLAAWGTTSDYEAASGVDPDTNKALPLTGDTANQAAAAQATLIFNAWLTRAMSRTFGDEQARMKLGFDFDHQEVAKAFLRLCSADPATLATYDAATKDSSLWDDLDTPAIESRHERMVRALLDALADLGKSMGTDISAWRWGAQHTITFGALVPVWGSFSIPPTTDSVFYGGFPRKGDSFSVDACEYHFVNGDSDLDFSYTAGPSQRFVIELDPAGLKAFNALPGGNVWDPKSPHFADEAELWRRNQNHPVPFTIEEVIAAKEKRTLVSSP